MKTDAVFTRPIRAEETFRQIILRTHGHSHGRVTRLVSPGDIGERIKPFVFLDYFDADPATAPKFGFHPHSGIATLTLILAGEAFYKETTGREGVIETGGVEWMRASSGVWHTGGMFGEQIGVQLFDRSGRYPKLTPAGLAILGDARSIITGVDLLKARAKGMSVGLEPELSVVIDVFYPIDAITQVAKEFRQKYPGVALRIYVEALGGAIKPVLDGRCSIGVIGSLPTIPDTLTYERLPGIAFLMVAARDHALTSYRGKIPKEVLGKHTQIVLTDRSELSSGREFGVM